MNGQNQENSADWIRAAAREGTVKGEQWQIVGTFFEVQAENNRVQLSEDHDHFLWIDPQEYKKYNLILNLVPAFEAYLKK